MEPIQVFTRINASLDQLQAEIDDLARNKLSFAVERLVHREAERINHGLDLVDADVTSLLNDHPDDFPVADLEAIKRRVAEMIGTVLFEFYQTRSIT